MGESDDFLHCRIIRQDIAESAGDSFSDTVDAAHGRNDPQLVSYPDSPVASPVAFERGFYLRFGDLCRHRRIFVFKDAFKIGFQYPVVYKPSFGDILKEMPDRISVFYDILTF